MTALPPVSAVPADVRREGGTDAYRSALAFEGMLLDRLSEVLVQDAGLEDSPYSDHVTGAFSDSLLAGGGLGLAEDLYSALRGGRS